QLFGGVRLGRRAVLRRKAVSLGLRKCFGMESVELKHLMIQLGLDELPPVLQPLPRIAWRVVVRRTVRGCPVGEQVAGNRIACSLRRALAHGNVLTSLSTR